MGMFKQMKDMKNVVAAAPSMIHQGQQLAAQAQAFAAAQAVQYAAVQSAPIAEADLAPIAGVDLATYAWIAKQIVPYNYDQSLLPGFAAQKGITSSTWEAAAAGWSVRMTNPAIAREFRRLYDAA